MLGKTIRIFLHTIYFNSKMLIEIFESLGNNIMNDCVRNYQMMFPYAVV